MCLPSKIIHYVANTVGGACGEPWAQEAAQTAALSWANLEPHNDHLLNATLVKPRDS